MVLIVGLIFAVICAVIASGKGRNVIGWFFLGFFFGIFALIAACIASDVQAREQKETELAHENRRLQEQVLQERIKSERFQQQAQHRLDTHDSLLNVDTRSSASLPDHNQAIAGVSTPPPVPDNPEDSIYAQGWYYQQGESAVGPFDLHTMIAYLQQGSIPFTTNVWHERLEIWKPAEQVECLRRGGLP